jgi:hypothetical protein
MSSQDPPSSPASECRAEAAAFAVGRVLDAALTNEVRTRANAQRVRVLRPGEMSTMEFDAQRLTLEVDAANRVTVARCG